MEGNDFMDSIVIPIVSQSELLRNLEITMVNADRKLESHWEFANQRLSLISNRYYWPNKYFRCNGFIHQMNFR